MKRVKLSEVLKQYRITHYIDDARTYKQVTISKHSGVSYRGQKQGSEIGRKRQFIIDLKKYPNTLLFIRQGLEEGGIGLAPPEVDQCIVTENMPMFSVENVHPQYLAAYLKSSTFRRDAAQLQSIGSAQKAIHERDLLKLTIPLPDADTQLAIVNRIAEYDNALAGIDAELAHQATLLTRLRQAVLREAVQGRLVPQHPTDEPAPALLARIRAEKQRLVKEKKLRAEKPLPPLSKADVPYEVPEGWAWCRIEEACDSITDCVNKTAPLAAGVTPYKMLRTTNVRNGKVDTLNVRYVSEETYLKWTARDKPCKGDLILTREAPLGEVGLIEADDTIFLGQRLVQYRADNRVLDKDFLFYVFSSPFMKEQIRQLGIGMTVKHLRVPDSKILVFPLPPLPEQRRIVAKVTELLGHCAALEAEGQRARQAAEALHAAALREAFAPVPAGVAV